MDVWTRLTDAYAAATTDEARDLINIAMLLIEMKWRMRIAR